MSSARTAAVALAAAGIVTITAACSNYLATTRTGQSYVVSVLTANPTTPIPTAATAQLLGAVKGPFTLGPASDPS